MLFGLTQITPLVYLLVGLFAFAQIGTSIGQYIYNANKGGTEQTESIGTRNDEGGFRHGTSVYGKVTGAQNRATSSTLISQHSDAIISLLSHLNSTKTRQFNNESHSGKTANGFLNSIANRPPPSVA